MSFYFRSLFWAAAGAAAMSNAYCQTRYSHDKADEQVATPWTPSVEYISTFSNYRAFIEQPLVSWREANDTVLKIGGWRTYAKESQASEATTTAPLATPGVRP